MTAALRGPRARIAVGTAAAVLLAGGAVAVASGGFGADAAAPADGSATGGPAEAVPDASLPDMDTAALVEAFQEASPGDLEITRLADGVVPPTNRWFSGLVFGEEPQPVFPLPVSFGLTEGGFALGAPVPVASENAVVGPHVPGVTVGVGSTSAQVVAYDVATVTVELLDSAGSPSATVVLGQGSPFVTVTAQSDLDLTTDVGFAAAEDGGATALVGDREWGLVTEGSLEGSGVRLTAGQAATFYPLPDDVSDRTRSALASAAADPVVGAELTYGVGEDTARTTLSYVTRDGGTTVLATMPHHHAGTGGELPDGCDLGTYPSVYGPITLCEGNELVTTVPALEPTATLDLSGLSEEQRALLVEQLRADVAATPAYPSDTYFGAKALYRSAMLVSLGRDLGAPEVVEALAQQTSEAIREWAEPHGCLERDARCFVYDPVARGVVGLTPSFGSEVFNDHHFHWGYLLAATGILGADDPDLVQDVAPLMDLLAQDIAAPQASEWFPQMRPFDPYRGHSWASGTSPFADGNNQESTSEGVSAWNGLGLWARVSGQPELETQAAWMMSTEAATARAYWTEPDVTDPAFAGFGHEMFSIAWGAKRDYATWFSAEPNAMMGIQLIPMVPVAGAMAADPDKVRATVAEAAPDGYGVQFGDYLIMYLALVDPEAARAAEADLPEESIDDANSRTYLRAWLASPPARAGA
ncbi:MAG: glycoside hydrolase family 81 [Actinotalea sp.]|nr:glycoside hydrolase family 81 [Actinotalea sp.]